MFGDPGRALGRGGARGRGARARRSTDRRSCSPTAARRSPATRSRGGSSCAPSRCRSRARARSSSASCARRTGRATTPWSRAPDRLGGRRRADRRAQPHDRPHAHGRRAAPGRGAPLRGARPAPAARALNVARGAQALGRGALLVALLPGHTGTAVGAMIADEGIALLGVPCGGEVRSTAVVLEPDGRSTVLNEHGPGDPAGRVGAAFEAARGRRARPAPRAACARAACRRAHRPDAYARLTALAREHGVTAIVDAAGPAVGAALAAAPDLVTPNLAEAEAALGARRRRRAGRRPARRPRRAPRRRRPRCCRARSPRGGRDRRGGGRRARRPAPAA